MAVDQVGYPAKSKRIARTFSRGASIEIVEVLKSLIGTGYS
jgi:hypothetical protein